MKPIDIIYWIKAGLGVLAAFICTFLGIQDLLTGIAIGLLVFAISDRILRQLFINKVDNLSTVTKTGIGAYIITWIFFWALLYTLRYPPVPPS